MDIVTCGFGNVSEVITANKDIVHIASIPLSPLKKVPSVMTVNSLNGRKKTMWNNRHKGDAKMNDMYVLKPQSDYEGLKRKYVVLKSDTGECVEGCFVLRPDKDPAAKAALMAYAAATTNEKLAEDIMSWLSSMYGGQDNV